MSPPLRTDPAPSRPAGPTRLAARSEAAATCSPRHLRPWARRWRPPAGWRPGPESLLRERNFLNLLAAQVVSQLGSQVSALALPLIAILVVRATAFEVAMVGAVQLLPFLVFSLPAGVWVDRLPRRQILILCDLGSALLLLSIPAAYSTGMLTLAHLYSVGFLRGVLALFADVARQAYLPTLVERRRLLEGNARLEIGRSGAQVAGPGLAGGLVNAVSAPAAVLADALSFFGSALFLFRIRVNEPPGPPGRSPTRLGSEIGEGLRYVLRQPLLRPILVTTSASNLLLGMSGAIHLLFLVRELHLSAGLLGAVFAAGNGGFVLGAAAATRLRRRLGLGPTICLAAAGGGVPLLLIASTPAGAGGIPFLVTAGLVGSFGSVVYGINQVSLRQAITPQRLQGRMNATMKFMVMGATPIGSVIGGILGGAIGLRPTMWVAAAGGCLAALPMALSPLRRVRDLPAVEEPEAGPPVALPVCHPGAGAWVALPRRARGRGRPWSALPRAGLGSVRA